ncbi:MAG: DUF493 family protein [Candidatus Omnitrophica bacterium]|nr:DUF493 family protein [Candidatus Omnitrophota bacterium]MBD3269205.1 DUF493 family protein [Candidatus Omnitrophota bacterium]
MEPRIGYPCEWSYTVIGRDEEIMRGAVSEVMDDKKFTLSFSKKSSGGKYISLNIKTLVFSEEERNKIYTSLCATEAIKMVL